MSKKQVEHKSLRVLSLDPELFQKAVEVDRRLGELVGKGGLKFRPYIHPSTQPLEHATNAQPSLFKQCGGYCWS